MGTGLCSQHSSCVTPISQNQGVFISSAHLNLEEDSGQPSRRVPALRKLEDLPGSSRKQKEQSRDS